MDGYTFMPKDGSPASFADTHESNWHGCMKPHWTEGRKDIDSSYLSAGIWGVYDFEKEVQGSPLSCVELMASLESPLCTFFEFHSSEQCTMFFKAVLLINPQQ